jgi:hypothetical protein
MKCEGDGGFTTIINGGGGREWNLKNTKINNIIICDFSYFIVN